jgi:hypothetical protein
MCGVKGEMQEIQHDSLGVGSKKGVICWIELLNLISRVTRGKSVVFGVPWFLTNLTLVIDLSFALSAVPRALMEWTRCY